MSADRVVCIQCIGERFLKAHISAPPSLDENCDFCGSEQPAIELCELADLCQTVLNNFFRITNYDKSVYLYGRTPGGACLPEVLAELIQPNPDTADELAFDLAAQVISEWEWDDGEELEPEEVWYERSDAFSNELSDVWQKMKRSLQFEARFVNPSVSQMLEKIFGPIASDRTAAGKSAVLEINPGNEEARLYRARVFQSLDRLEEALTHPERHMGPPPAHFARAGRMNAKGVSVFYSATHPDTALSEVRPPVGSHVLMAPFNVIRPLRLLDFSVLESLTLNENVSFFSEEALDHATRHSFLAQLQSELVMPVMPDLEDEGYLPSQVVADYLVTNDELNLDGICFRSAQSEVDRDETSGLNVILFNKAAGVDGAGDQEPLSDVSLWEYDEESTYFYPEITQGRGSVKPQKPFPSDHKSCKSPALELDRAGLRVYKIKGVSFSSDVIEVRNSMRYESPKSADNSDQ